METGSTGALPWRDGGVYLITGGAGGLGLIVAQEIARSTSHAHIVLSGRSALTPEREQRLEGLRAAHRGAAQIDYQIMDVTDEPAVRSGIAEVLTRYGALPDWDCARGGRGSGQLHLEEECPGVPCRHGGEGSRDAEPGPGDAGMSWRE